MRILNFRTLGVIVTGAWPIVLCLLASVSVQASGHPVAWRAIPQKAFSRTTEPLVAKSYTSVEESAVIKREIDACVAGGRAENCIDMVLRGFSLVDEAEFGRLLDLTEQLWPVDLTVVAGERRAIPGATSVDIKRLDDIARTSGVVFGFNNLKSRRRQLASSIAAWRGGEDSPPETGSIEDWITALGADHPLIGQLQALRIAASLDRASGGIPSADDVKWAVEAHRRDGRSGGDQSCSCSIAPRRLHRRRDARD